MPIATSSAQREPQGPRYRTILPKPTLHHNGQRSPTLVTAGGNVFTDPLSRVQEHTISQSTIQDSQGHLFSARTPPILNVSPGLSPIQEQHRTSPHFDLIDVGLTQFRNSLQGLHENMSQQMQHSQQIFSGMHADDSGRKSESPSRKRRRISISSQHVIDLTTSSSTQPTRPWETTNERPARRRNASQRRISGERNSTNLCGQRSPTSRRYFRERQPPRYSQSPERRAFQPPNLSTRPPLYMTPLPQHNVPSQQPIVLEQVPVSLPLSMGAHAIPVCTGPHIPMCTAPHLSVCQGQTLPPTCGMQFPACNIQQLPSCGIQQLPISHPLPPVYSHHHQHHLTNAGQFTGSPPGPQGFYQDSEIDILSEHRPTAFQQLSSAVHHVTPLPPSPPLHLLQEPSVRPAQPEAHFHSIGPYSRIRRGSVQTRRGSNRRWRVPLQPTLPPPPPPPYPGFLLHFLAMLSNPSVPAYSMDMANENAEAENYEALLNLAERLGEAKPKGLTKAEIEQLPSYRFNSETHQSDQTSCVVCMCDFEQRQLLRVLPCGHEFHAKCVDKWLKTNRTCPICRGNASEYFNHSD